MPMFCQPHADMRGERTPYYDFDVMPRFIYATAFDAPAAATPLL